MTGWGEALKPDRERALEEAAATLNGLGFAPRPSGDWEGTLTHHGEAVPVRVHLPVEFPDKLPEIFLSDPSAAAVQSHIEQSGKICIAAATGHLLDVERPAALVSESLNRARAVLNAPPEEQQRDLQAEFVSYWPDRNDDVDFVSIVDASKQSREIVVSRVSLFGTRLLFADDNDQLKKWVDNTRATHSDIERTFFARLSGDFTPPRFDQRLSTRQFEDLLSTQMSAEGYARWKRWDHGRRPPIAVLLGKPLPDKSWAVFAIRPADLTTEQERALRNPYSGKKPSAKKVRGALTANLVKRRAVIRADPSYLLERTVGSTPLRGFRIAVVGCGAIGSQIAVALAATGAQCLDLIDKEKLGSENVHRHVLGISSIGQYKANALAELLTKRFPHTTINPISRSVEAWMDERSDSLDDIDIAVIALGDETLERRLNRYLGSSLVRVHAWIEPLGLGGHCLVVPGANHKGCYECLYARDSKASLYNMAALSAPGQNFQRTTGGCAGTYTPFGYAETLDAAARTVRALIRVSSADPMIHELVSWIGDERPFLKAGYSLSKRGGALVTTREEHRSDVARTDCGVCSIW